MRLHNILMILFLLNSCLFCKDRSDQYLEPEDGSFLMPRFDSYYSNVYKVLLRPLKDRPIIKMIAIPSFDNEWVSGVFEKDSKYYIFSSRSKIHIWKYETLKLRENGSIRTIYSPKTDNLDSINNNEIDELKKTIPKSIDNVEVEYNENAISNDLYKIIHKTWLSILLRVRYTGEITGGLDGNTYHFTINDPDTWLSMSGKTWSPEENSLNYLSVLLGTYLYEYSNSDSNDEIILKILNICKDINNRIN